MFVHSAKAWVKRVKTSLVLDTAYATVFVNVLQGHRGIIRQLPPFRLMDRELRCSPRYNTGQSRLGLETRRGHSGVCI